MKLNGKRKMEKLKNFPRIFVFVIILLVVSTLTGWYVTKSVADRETAKLFNDEATVIEAWITNRLEFYKTITYSLQGFWAGNAEATKEERQAYLETLKIKERFPGITSVNLIEKKGDNFFFAFVYPPEIETTIEGQAITSPERLETIKKAIDNASLAFTDKVSLIPNQSPGFIMYAPLYKKGLPTETIEERRAAIEGLTAIVFKSQQVFKDLFDAKDTFPYLDFELFKGQVLEEDHILYDHDYSYYIPLVKPEDRLRIKRTIISDGETFTLLVSLKPDFALKTLDEKLPNLVLIIGLFFDFLIFLFAIIGFCRLQKR
jgi:CHASE1-domain containing sensor protein